MSAETNRPHFTPLDSMGAELESQINQTLINRFLKQDCCALQPNLSSYGTSGVYALYYYGDDSFYAPVSNVAHQTTIPLFIGVSHPTAYSTYSAPDKQSLAHVIQGHRTRLANSDRFDISEFKIRILPLELTWIHHTAHLLIDAYQPWWNTYIPGFRTNTDSTVWTEFHDMETHDETRTTIVEPAIERAKSNRTYKDRHNIDKSDFRSPNAPAREEATLHEFTRE